MAVEQPPDRHVCLQWKYEVGVYVLGALTPVDRHRVERHLSCCPACRDELARLAGLPGLLGRLTEAEAVGRAEPCEPPGGSGDEERG